MKHTQKHMPFLIGMRTFKTALACAFAVSMGYVINSPYPPFLAIGALGCMESSITTSLRSARDAVADRRSLSISSLIEESFAI